MDNVLYSDAGDLFKIRFFNGFLKSLDFILVSLELFVPDAATDQCKTKALLDKRGYAQLQLLSTLWNFETWWSKWDWYLTSDFSSFSPIPG